MGHFHEELDVIAGLHDLVIPVSQTPAEIGADSRDAETDTALGGEKLFDALAAEQSRERLRAKAAPSLARGCIFRQTSIRRIRDERSSVVYFHLTQEGRI